MSDDASESAVAREASGWLVRQHASDLSDEERREFEDWMRTPSHAAAYEAVKRTWDQLGALSPSAERSRRRPSSLGRGQLIQLTALAAVILIAAVFVLRPIFGRSVITADVGQHVTTTLPDGSTVTLNAASEISYRFSQSHRKVRLIRGDVLFDVAPDTARPFTVSTPFGGFHVRGTTFLVVLKSDSARATVFHGEVEGIAQESSPAVLPVVARTREDILLTRRSIALGEVLAEDATRRVAWKEGMLAFSGETLEQAAAEVTRQTGVAFEFSDPALKELRIGGYFKADDPEAFVGLLKDGVGVSADRVSPKRIRLYRSGLP